MISRFDKALLVRTKITRLVRVRVYTTVVAYDLCYVIYVNRILDMTFNRNTARVINKKYLHFSFNFYCSFHCYKYLN